MAEQEFNIFKGLVVNDFVFRGVDASDGATFEHPCGYVVRIGPDSPVSIIAEEVQEHRCEVEGPDAETRSAELAAHRRANADKCPECGKERPKDNPPGPPPVPGQWYCLTHRHLKRRTEFPG